MNSTIDVTGTESSKREMMLRFSGIKQECYLGSHLPFEKIQLGVFTDRLYSKIIIKHLYI